MTKKTYRTCIVCGRNYKYCSSNCDDQNMERWHTMYHDKNCHDIWHTLSDWESNFITKEEAIEQLKALDTSVITNPNALESYKKLIDISKEENKKSEAVPSPTPVTATKETVASVVEEEKSAKKAPHFIPLKQTETEDKHLSVSEELKHQQQKAQPNKRATKK